MLSPLAALVARPANCLRRMATRQAVNHRICAPLFHTAQGVGLSMRARPLPPVTCDAASRGKPLAVPNQWPALRSEDRPLLLCFWPLPLPHPATNGSTANLELALPFHRWEPTFCWSGTRPSPAGTAHGRTLPASWQVGRVLCCAALRCAALHCCVVNSVLLASWQLGCA